MSFVRSHGTAIYYERHGQGPAVLFCHGAGSNAATWWQQIPRFAQHFTCLVYDHRGMGRSAAEPASFVPQCFVDDALAILDAEGIARAALVCQSLGGVTGLRLACGHPDRVWAFVPCDSPLGVAHAPLLESLQRFMDEADTTPVEERAFAPGYAAAQPEAAFLYAQINRFNPAVFAPAPGMAGWQARLRALLAPPHLLPLAALAQVHCPTLFVTGRHDRLVTPALAAALARCVPGSATAVIEGAGHSPYYEQAAAFNAAVLSFLQRAGLEPFCRN
ncbi:alpha/beta fold hydrolase [Variovorax terrae]|uniref:Alpha/beta hydrolase n=1 Tax=Variovorax terrae TaxID=2923278 RepID=A0A9X1VUF8_9BURK|nr:alpha/beta hydrolase [Variovorax terrae]